MWYLIKPAAIHLHKNLYRLAKKTQPVAIVPPPTPTTIKPIFKPEVFDTIFDILKDHFNIEQQTQLKEILQTGDDTDEPLIFLGNGNRLADAFKQLFEKDFITGCQKQELENWILANFQYLSNKQPRLPKKYNPRSLEKIISGKQDPCKHPIFKIELVKGTGELIIGKI